MSLDEEVEKKRRQALRRNEPELRSFERNLRNEYVANEQACQIIENQFRKLQDEVTIQKTTC